MALQQSWSSQLRYSTRDIWPVPARMQFLAYAAGGSQESGNYSWETNIVQEPAKVWFLACLLLTKH
jgi:hypothetical protein